MRSWLSNPVVGLLNLLAAAVTVGQWTFSMFRLAHRMTRIDGWRRRASIWVALVSLGAVAVIAPLSWSAIVTEAVKAGNGGVWGALYPPMVDGLSASGALALLIDVIDRRRFSVLACCSLVLGLAYATWMYVLSGAPGWGRYVAVAVPLIAVLTLPLVALGRTSPAQRSRSHGVSA